MKTRKIYSLLVGVLALLMSGLVSAIPALPPSPASTLTNNVGYFDLDPSSVTPFPSGGLTMFGADRWVELDHDDATSSGNTLLSITGAGIGNKTGGWTIEDIWGDGTLGTYKSLAIGIKAGNTSNIDVWLLSFGDLSGDWTTFQNLSNMRLFGTNELDGGGSPPSSVPLPAAVWLFGSSMLGLIGFSRRKA